MSAPAILTTRGPSIPAQNTPRETRDYPMAERTPLQPPTQQPYQDPCFQHHTHLSHHFHPRIGSPGLDQTSCHHPLELQTPLEQYRGTGIEAAPRTTLPDSSPYYGGSRDSYRGGGRGGYVDIRGRSRGDNCSDVECRDGCFGAQKASYCNRRVADDVVSQGDDFDSHFESQSLAYASQKDEGCDGDDSSASGNGGGDVYHRIDEGSKRDDVFYRTDEGCNSSRDDVFYSNSRDHRCEEKTDEGSNTRDEVFYRMDDNRNDVFRRTDEVCSNRDDVFYSRDYMCEERGDGNSGYRDTTTSSHDGGNNRADHLYNGSDIFDDTGNRDSLRKVDDFGGDCDDFGDKRSNLDPPEAQFKPGFWVSPSPPDQGSVAWEDSEKGRGYPKDWSSLYSYSQAASGPSGGGGVGVYRQKLDSFSEAFFFRRNVAGNRIPNGNSGSGVLGFGVGGGSNSLTDSSTLPRLPHPFPLLLSPPPSPLPPPKLTMTPSLGTVELTQTPGGDCSGTVEFYPSSHQPLHTSHPSTVIWKLPPCHWLQQSGEVGVVDGNPSSAGHVYRQEAVFTQRHVHQDYENDTGHYSLQTPVQSNVVSSSPFHPSLHPTSLPSLHPTSLPSLHPSSPPSQHPSGLPQHGAASLVVYRGTPFTSPLQSHRGGGGGQRGVERIGRGLHYTPLPMLNPQRRGTGLLFSLIPPSAGEREMGRMTEEEKGYFLLPCINVGRGFQAELPCCLEREEGSGAWPEESSSNEELLWKPWEELQRSSVIQEKVEAVLSLCSSSCLPGGGSNTELALHCLYLCHGDTLATLERLFFSNPSTAVDYHYAGSDVWQQTERSLFSKALTTHGKDFSLIQQMVQTKCVSQCVEFYYLSKKLPDEQRNRGSRNEGRRNGRVWCPSLHRWNGRYQSHHWLPASPVSSVERCSIR
uniref:Transcriptional-regulating factor 1-like n=2 Tax=Salmo trutta TaxID=8032 RepID=A0A673WQM6_SALTR